MTSLIGTVRERLGGSQRESSPLTVLAGFAVAAILLFAVAPAVLSDFRLNLLAKFLCFAIVAVGIGLAWGRGGMLTLGQGVFFGLGAYIMAMHMQMADAARMKQDVPGFMQIAGIRELPTLWQPFASAPVTLIAILVVPGLVAAVLGYGVFKRRVKGAYFAILSQALAAAMAILLTGQQMLGGFTGLSDFRAFFGFKLSDPANRQMLFFIAAGTLLVVVAIVRQLMYSRYGELLVAVRDQEERVRFLGYDPANVKILAYVVAAVFAGVAGALFTPIVGIISPADIGVVPSIAFLIGVAIGGRTTLLGPVLGAIGVAWAQTTLSEQFPSGWTYLQGILFIVVVGFIPAGLAGVWPMAKGFWQSRFGTPATSDTPVTPVEAAPADDAVPAAAEPKTLAAPETAAAGESVSDEAGSVEAAPDEEQKVESR
ncbi:urea ABC transporter permease subunit UrtC [Nocardia higoensis]|uniref:urea ABC transporter permease subunit UrtC n=1 Tax=Nocardia higoensis TaxID=228599 RepID=UPI00031A5BA9|nr:urea ABC transporter permease subunit UrtC [Nocardia higoensis]